MLMSNNISIKWHVENIIADYLTFTIEVQHFIKFNSKIDSFSF